MRLKSRVCIGVGCSRPLRHSLFLFLFLFPTAFAQSDWIWRNPWPAGGGLSAMVWTGNQIVGVGGNRTLAISPDGMQWTVKTLPTDVRSMDWNKSRFVAVGGSILISEDGANWSVHRADFTASGFRSVSLVTVKWLGNQFFAVGNGYDTTRQITDQYRMVGFTSPDGLEWILRDLGKARSYLNDVAWSGNSWVVVGGYERILTSPDGLNWTVRHETEKIGQVLRSVVWTGNRFVVTGTGESRGVMFTSEDGLTWARDSTGMDILRMNWAGSPDSGGFGFVGIGEGVYSSPDGVDWKVLSDSARGGSAVWTGERLVLGSYYASPNGIDWTRYGGSETGKTFNGLTWASGVGAVAVGDSRGIATSPNGVDWSEKDLGPSGVDFKDVAWSPSAGFVAVGWSSEDQWNGNYGGAIYTSPDGVDWNKIASGRTPFECVAWTGDKFVAAGNGDTVYISSDGIQWNKANKGYLANFLGMTWRGRQIVAVGQAGSIHTSPDGARWTIQDSGRAGRILHSVVWTGSAQDFGPAQLVAVGQNGLVMTSPDGTDWTERSSGTTEHFQSIAWSGRWLVASTKASATTSSGNVFASSDGGITWRAFLTGSFNAHNAVTWAGDKFIVAGYGGHILTAADDEPVSILAQRNRPGQGLSLRLSGNTLIFTLPPSAAHITSSEMAAAIYTLSGRRVQVNPRFVMSGSQGKLSIAPLTPGPYLLELKAKGNRFARPFILGR